MVAKMRDNHPNLFHRITEQQFTSGISAAKVEIRDVRSAMECYLAIKKVVASIQDGHTQLFDRGNLGIEELRYPFRLEAFSDGIFVTVIRKDYKRYLASQVLRINGMPIDGVLALTTAITSMDNQYGRIRPSVQDITFPRTLYGLGIIVSDYSVELAVVTKDGSTEEVRIEAVNDNTPINWSNWLNMGPTAGDYVNAATLLGDKTPLHLKKLGDNVEYYWFEHLADEKSIYLQYNQVADQSDHFETWAEFTERVWNYIDHHKADIGKLIIDLRYNDGGIARMFMPFLNHIIRSEALSQRGSLFVLTSNRTFSAAVIIMTEFSVHTEAIFVGTPAASPFNSFSSMNVVGIVPNRGWGVGVSSRQNDNSWSSHRQYYPPDILAPFTSQDFFLGRDPALSVIFSDMHFATLAED